MCKLCNFAANFNNIMRMAGKFRHNNVLYELLIYFINANKFSG